MSQIPSTPLEGMTAQQAAATDMNGMRLLRGGIKHPHAPMWRGDHKKCAHAEGSCSALTGWMLDGDGRAVPARANIPTGPQARGTVTTWIHSTDPLTGSAVMVGKTEEVWRYKGNVSLGEAVGVRPAPPVLARLIIRSSRDLAKQVGSEPFETRKRIVADFEAKCRAANAEPARLEKPTRTK